MMTLTAAVLALSSLVSATPSELEQCAECHGADGMGTGRPLTPILAGMPEDHIIEAIYAYVDGARQCVREPRMCETVGALDEGTVEALAEHYAGLVRQASDIAFDEGLAAEGAELYETLCAACHRRPDDPAAAAALGIPLHGQRPDYLRYALEAYRSGHRTELIEAMSEKIDELKPGDLEALVHYFASYRPGP